MSSATRRQAKAAVIDPVLGFSIVSGRTDTVPVDGICEFLDAEDLELEWILETHAHADHLSAAQILKARLGGKIAIGQGICKVQENFATLFNLKHAVLQRRQPVRSPVFCR